MKVIKFSDISCETQDCRKEALNKWLDKYEYKRVKENRKRKTEHKRESRKRIREQKLLNGEIKVKKRSKNLAWEGGYKLHESFRFGVGINEVNMLQSMLENEYVKECGLNKPYLFRKMINIFYTDFMQNKRLFADKVAAAALYGEVDDVNEALEMAEFIKMKEALAETMKDEIDDLEIDILIEYKDYEDNG